jgi:hypothetical protein
MSFSSTRALKLRLVEDVVAGEEKHGGKRRRFGPSFTVEVQDASTTGKEQRKVVGATASETIGRVGSVAQDAVEL